MVSPSENERETNVKNGTVVVKTVLGRSEIDVDRCIGFGELCVTGV